MLWSRSTKKQITDQFRSEIKEKKIEVLDIPDEYEYLNAELIELIQSGVEGYLNGAVE